MQTARLGHLFTIRLREYPHFYLRILGVFFLSTAICVSSAWAVFPKSSVISSVVWDFAGMVKGGEGSDLWPVTWGKDGVTYVAWGDGGGPDGTNTACRTRFGLNRMTGSPPHYGFTEIWGCKADGTGCGANATHDAACDAPYGGTIAALGVPDGLVAIDDTLYALIWNSTDGEKLVYSTNDGHSWTDPDTAFPYGTNGLFVPTSFVQHGKGDAGGSATYMYIAGEKYGTPHATYLARAPKATITNAATWEYFTGTATSPSWGSWNSATAIFYDAGAKLSVGRMQYFPLIGKYIYTETRGEIQKLGMYEADTPWGPWKTIYMNDTWGDYGTTGGLWYSIIPSSISEDNMTFYMTFSGYPTPVNWDNYNLIKGTFVLQPTTNARIPMSPFSLAIH